MSDFYVSQQRGSDTIGLGTALSPFRTPAKAVASMANGDRIGLFPGTYPALNGNADLNKVGEWWGLTEGKDFVTQVFEAPGLVKVTRQELNLTVVPRSAISLLTNLVPNYALKFFNLVFSGEELDANKTGRPAANLNNYLGAQFINCILLGGWDGRTDLGAGGGHLFIQCLFTLWPNAFLGNVANVNTGVLKGLSPYDGAGGLTPYAIYDSIFDAKLLIPHYFAQTGVAPVRALVSNNNDYWHELAGKFAFNTSNLAIIAANFAAWQALSLINDNKSINLDPLLDENNLWKPAVNSPVINKGSGLSYRFLVTDIAGSVRG